MSAPTVGITENGTPAVLVERVRESAVRVARDGPAS
jgi:hypothetical protein